MNFEKLDIYGFKSFADKVEIKFENGITAIVGPNGCGKSNVADSIRFVMGESSAKQMRGSSMQDVIFNGTEKRKPQSYCEVSLYFNNKNKIFDLDYEEVVLTRKLYKSGDSEYLINKTNCRKKDIVDAFRQIGLGKESYSVIGQGKIDSLLSAKPEDRRNVFEEAAGISKFKEEKASSENKLINVNDNLTRINDILAELEKQLGPLKNQAEAAKTFLTLSNRLKELETNIYIYQYDHSNSEKQKIYDIISAIDEEIALRQSEFDRAVSEYDLAQSQIESLDGKIELLRDELLNLTVSLEKQNGEIKLYNEKISILKEQNEKNLQTKEIGQYVVATNTKKVEELKIDLLEKQKQLESYEQEQKILETDYKTVIEKLSFGEVDAQNVDSIFVDAIEQSGDAKSRLFKFETERDVLKQKQTEIHEQKDRLCCERREIEDKLNLYESQYEKIENQYEEENVIRSQIIEKIASNNEEIDRISNEIDDKKVAYHSDLSRFNLLSEMKEYNEGFAVSVKRLLEQAQSGTSLGGKVVGAVASLMRVPAQYETAIEMALGASIQNIVTKNEEDAKELIAYLKTNKFGRVTFLPISGVKERSISSLVESKLSMQGVLGIASDLISFEEEYRRVFSSLLGSTIIIDNLDNAVEFSKATNYQSKIVTLEGDIISPQGSMTGGSRKENNTNILGRDREIESLKQSNDQLKSEIDALSNYLSELKNISDKLNNDLNKKIESMHNLKLEISKNQENQDRLELQISEIDEELSNNDIEFSAILNKLEFVESEISNMTQMQQDLDSKKTLAVQNKKDVSSTYEKLRIERDEVYEKLGNLKVLIESKRNEIKISEAEIERLSLMIAENEYKAKDVDIEIQKNETQISEIEQKISDIMAIDEFAQSAQKVERVREKIANSNNEKKNYQQQMNEADANKMMLAGEIQRANEKKAKEETKLVKIDTDLENLQNRVWEEYEMTYGDAKKFYDELFDIKEGTEECLEVKRKIQRLGNVNLAAIEDIKTVSERYDDMSKQRDDMIKAQTDLKLIIKDLTTKMEEKFKECFDKIRGNFQIIFKELFGGGKADIMLNDENNILDCGIDIIAEPPGKKLQNISLLSGGERALTAVAILFSILKLRSMPFCVLDEIEAALDDANVERYAKYLHRYTGETQFIVITHRKPTMELADALYGVTMEEKGVSKVVSVKLSDAIKIDGGE